MEGGISLDKAREMRMHLDGTLQNLSKGRSEGGGEELWDAIDALEEEGGMSEAEGGKAVVTFPLVEMSEVGVRGVCAAERESGTTSLAEVASHLLEGFGGMKPGCVQPGVRVEIHGLDGNGEVVPAAPLARVTLATQIAVLVEFDDALVLEELSDELLLGLEWRIFGPAGHADQIPMKIEEAVADPDG